VEPLRPQAGSERIAQAIHRHEQTILNTTPPIAGVPLFQSRRFRSSRHEADGR
jgi:hypothetical protein